MSQHVKSFWKWNSVFLWWRGNSFLLQIVFLVLWNNGKQSLFIVRLAPWAGKIYCSCTLIHFMSRQDEAILPASYYQKFPSRTWHSLSRVIILTKLIWSRWLDSSLDVDCISVHNNEKRTWVKYSHLDLMSGQQPAYFHWLQILLTYPTIRAQRFIDLSKINALLIFLSKLLWTAMEVHKILPAVLCLVSVWEPCIKWSSLQFKFLFFFCHDLCLSFRPLQVKDRCKYSNWWYFSPSSFVNPVAHISQSNILINPTTRARKRKQ